MNYFLKLVGWLGLLIGGSFGAEELPSEVSFNEHIRPIFSSTCFNCHGPDEHEAKAHLQLHTFAAATEKRTYKTKSGALKTKDAVIVPGKPEESLVWDRIATDDEDDVMPPLDFHIEITTYEKALIKKWIEQGAKYQAHWAYEPVSNRFSNRKDSAIDELVLEKLKEKGFKGQNEIEEKRVLIRRLSLDLRGILPSHQEVADFLNDNSSKAWEALIDQFLASPSYGERMGVHWFDLVRYSNSVGFHGDQELRSSPYRDYVIDAFNTNMPFDQFTREQLAGDLLENPTESQIIATAYNRLNKMTKEGGAQPGEYLSKYAADRVSNLSSVWLGSTLQCAQCHNHKYDPFSAKDFYTMAAFFADVKQKGVYGGGNNNKFAPELVILPKAEKEKLTQLEKELQSSSKSLSLYKNETKKILAEKVKGLKKESKELKNITKEVEAARKEGLSKINKEVKQVTNQVKVLREKARICLITETVNPPLETRLLPRGNWMDKSGEIVEPAVPHFLEQIKKEGRATRLDLANWLCSEKNPLAARAFVNRLWSMFFGHGISQLTEDLGSQGEYPVNPALLDYLARSFIEGQWDIKAIVKEMVMSKTYQLSTDRAEEMKSKDPYNRYLARQSIIRLNAEFIRDTSLQVSGLLNTKMGGRNVMPYQPEGYYSSMNFNPFRYKPEKDGEQYRKAVYMHWQRTFLHPFLKNFDAPEREVGVCERTASNTPLQALTLLNDPTFVESARSLGELMVKQKGGLDEKVAWVIEHSLGRLPMEEEVKTLASLYQSQLTYFKTHPESLQSFLKVGNKKVEPGLNLAEVAAYTQVARSILNLHEFIVRR